MANTEEAPATGPAFDYGAFSFASKEEVLAKAKEFWNPGKTQFWIDSGVPLVIDRREDYFLYDMSGKRLIDLHLNGGTYNLGHRNPEVVQAVTLAMQHFDVGNHHFPALARTALAEALITSAPQGLTKVIYGSGGGEAIDIALKTARHTTQKRKILSIVKAYHGHTGLAVATGDERFSTLFLSDRPEEFPNVPFNDLDDLKEAAPNMARDSVGYLGNFAKLATKESVMLLAGIVVAIGIFVNSRPKGPPGNLYAQYEEAIRSRFHAFYRSFETVMGAQLLISLINTVATAAFVLSTSLWPYAGIVIPLTFICGMLPIVGNLISNTLIVGIAFGLVSPQMALGSLVFLIVIHKMEYFFNSKIIGARILHPMWLTLVGLILGEALMGIPGVILAPVILNFLKVEGSRYALAEADTASK